jgi:protein SCO1/2
MRWLPVLLLLAWPAAASVPTDGLEWVQRQGAPVPMDAPLLAGDGTPATLRGVAGGLPLVLAPGYFRCPNLCGVVRDDLAATLSRSGMTLGRDYAVAVLSIDPAEGPADAAAVQAGWHALTGPAASVQATTDAIGFHARFDPALRQFLHPAGVAVLTPGGLVSGYVLGVGYDPAALRDAVRLARGGGQAQANPVLLLCFHWDAATGRYTPSVEKMVRAGGVLTVLLILGTLVVAHWTRHP